MTKVLMGKPTNACEVIVKNIVEKLCTFLQEL